MHQIDSSSKTSSQKKQGFVQIQLITDVIQSNVRKYNRQPHIEHGEEVLLAGDCSSSLSSVHWSETKTLFANVNFICVKSVNHFKCGFFFFY